MTQYLLIAQKKAVKAQQGEMMTVRTLLGIQIMGEREKKNSCKQNVVLMKISSRLLIFMNHE